MDVATGLTAEVFPYVVLRGEHACTKMDGEEKMVRTNEGRREDLR